MEAAFSAIREILPQIDIDAESLDQVSPIPVPVPRTIPIPSPSPNPSITPSPLPPPIPTLTSGPAAERGDTPRALRARRQRDESLIAARERGGGSGHHLGGYRRPR